MVHRAEQMVLLQGAARPAVLPDEPRDAAPGGNGCRGVERPAHEREARHHLGGRGHGPGHRRPLRRLRRCARRLRNQGVRAGHGRLGHQREGRVRRWHAAPRRAHRDRGIRRHASAADHMGRRRLHAMRVRHAGGARRQGLRAMPSPRHQGRHLPHHHTAVRREEPRASEPRGHNGGPRHGLALPHLRAREACGAEPAFRLLRDGRQRVRQGHLRDQDGGRGPDFHARPHPRREAARVR